MLYLALHLYLNDIKILGADVILLKYAAINILISIYIIMESVQKHYSTLFLVIASFILIIVIFKWIDYLTANTYITECFTAGPVQEESGGATSHTVNLPLTTTYSCSNFCGPTARCSITGQQCSADIDCPGCQPYSPPLKKSPDCIPGDNDAGKLTVGVTPRYSPLTSG